ncbi:MAG: protein translocase subunit SecF [Acidobacteria bacterium]|nr:protein translocase subunit SecF [Acidobacteriota bacterium]
MHILANVNVNWLKLKWIFIILSLILLIIGWYTVIQRGGFIYGIDFAGGTVIKVKFAEKPQYDVLRDVLGNTALGKVEVTRFGQEDKNEVQIKLARVETEERLEFQKTQTIVYDAFHDLLDQDKSAQRGDLNKVGQNELAADLQRSNVLETMGILKSDATITEREQAYADLAARIIDLRTENGLITSLDELSEIEDLPKPLLDNMKNNYYLGSFVIIGIDSVGPKIGKQLREKAQMAVLLALGGMLIYIAFRFKFAYGIAAVIALVHDVAITLGLFSLMNKELSLVVVAALLTLVGYSMNDSIIVFDRIRENLKLMRNESFLVIINTSINQTLSRTIITTGTTFVAVFCLWLFGGETLEGFSLVLVIGILVGTYSSIAIASPLLFWWYRFLGSAKDKKSLKMA